MHSIILPTILFPVFAKASEKARQISCSSNERQIGLALMQYTQDYDEILVANDFYNNAGGPDCYIGLLQPYIKNVQVFVCPDDSAPVIALGNRKTSYVLNNSYNNAAAIGSMFEQFATQSRASGKDPSWTVFVADGGAPNSTDAPYAFQIYTITGANLTADPPYLQGQQGSVVGRHTGGANCAFMDGHVKCLRWTSCVRPRPRPTRAMGPTPPTILTSPNSPTDQAPHVETGAARHCRAAPGSVPGILIWHKLCTRPSRVSYHLETVRTRM